MRKAILTLGAAVVAAAAVAVPAAASAAPVYAKNGTYQFASNYTNGSSTPFMVSNSPLSYPEASQSIGANGATISATGPAYASSGVIVDLGKLSTLFDSSGNYTPPKVTGTGTDFPQVLYNLYFDTNGDGTYFNWNSSHDPYSYTGMSGDSAASMGPVNRTSDQADFTTFAGQPGASDLGGTLTGQMSMAAVQAAFANNTGGTTDPEVWAWIGVQTTPDQAATITSVNGNNLVSTYAAPVTGLKITPGYTSLTATWKASSAAKSYQVTVTQHNGSTVIATATVTGTSCRIGHLNAKNTYAVKVLAQPAAPGQKATVAYTTTK